MDYPCMICQNGDVYSNVVCDDCEVVQDHMKEVRESMEALVFHLNKISGAILISTSQEVSEKVRPIFQQLIDIEIKDPRK